AISLRADERSAAMVLERARDDLGCGRGAAVDEHDERHGLEDVAAARVALEPGLPGPSAAADDQPVGEEQIRDVDRGFEHAAGVIAQVEDHAVEPGWRLVAERQKRRL